MEASILYALPLGATFSIVTTSPRWKPLLEEGLTCSGWRSVRVGAQSGMAVLDLDRLPLTGLSRDWRRKLSGRSRTTVPR